MPETAAALSWADVLSRLRQYVGRRADPAAVDDVVGDILLRLVQSQEDLMAADNPAGWMFRVAKNVLADHHRRRDVQTRALNQVRREQDAPNDSGDTTDERSAFTELASCLRPLAQALPKPYDEALLLTDFEGLTQTAAAQKLGLSVSGMKSRVQRGRVRLKQAILRCCQVDLDSRGHVRDLQAVGDDDCC